MKLTKQQSKQHQKAMELVHSDRALTWEERLFILENYFESQGQLNALAGAFFTPYGLARDLSIEVGMNSGQWSLIDLCAGIGMLSFACEGKGAQITCVEFCEEYVTVGKRVMPSANWIHADVFSAPLGHYDFAISNPPFGAIKADQFIGKYSGSQFEYKVIERASRVADYGVFILPQQSAPFRLSGVQCFEHCESEKTQKFLLQTGIVMDPSCGIDTSQYQSNWKGVSPMCEVVCCDFLEGDSDVMPVFASALVAMLSVEPANGQTLDLFAEAA